ncbi:MAG: hypothetical protein VCA57_01470 [Pseudomonas sp.]|uniref:hypothetical protein n=1 Tax=Pseudomonas sp. TaxID=306 RepID=UPI003981ED74
MNTQHVIAILAFTFVAGAHAATPTTQSDQSTDTPVAAAKPQFEAATFEQHTKAMHDLHEKMMAARSPEERAALRHEGMASMQNGMAMMGQMRKDMGAGMHMGNHMGGTGMPIDCTGEDRRMEMMQLMLDQQVPAKQ